MEKFYLGMDIGTESVGMACTDEQYNLLRAKGKDLWAVRLFDEAKSAQERRIKRTARRRLQRRRQRVEFLQGVFAPFMQDDKFFIRLNNSGFYAEDKDERLKTKFSLFADENYCDVDFYNAYPTIFHLREKLAKGEKLDLRHYYLALHHIIKYRGHFLFEGENVSAVRDLNKLFEDYNGVVEVSGLENYLYLNKELSQNFLEIATSKVGLNDKKRSIISLFEVKDSLAKEWVSLLLGGTANPKKLFGEEFEDKYKEEKSIQFKGMQDEVFDSLVDVFDDEHFSLLQTARAIYNFIVFEKVLGGAETISGAMVAIYEKHKEDLKLLKKFVKENYEKDTYYAIFRSRKQTANYVNYVGYNKANYRKVNVRKCLDVKEFYKFLNKILKNDKVKDNEIYKYITREIENETFLPKIINADNGLFPHQINGAELDLILQNLCLYYPEFSEKDDCGFSPIEKIKKIFLFKIPYYVGPLNDTHSGKGNSWAVRKKGKITPWNFENMVDLGASNEKFIRKMTNKCSYLHNKDVLPKGSMYYQAFDVLNQINKLTIGGELISVELKKEIFKNVYLCYKKVSVKTIENYLVTSGKCSKEDLKETPIGGFDSVSGLKANMSSYVIFKEKFGEMVDKRPEIFEKIILWHTLNTDKSLVEKMVLDCYGEISEIKQNIKWIKGLTSFKEFGRLSYELLCELYGGVDIATGETYSILNRLYNTNDNFNQLLFGEKYTFEKEIDLENSGKSQEITYEDVAELYVSPMVRRGIWQSLQMVDEYVKAVGKVPDKIFIEFTRQDGEKGEKGRKKSRKSQILEWYKDIGADCRDIEELIKELNRDEMTDSRLRSERLYLYFMQLGRCVYTGERIDLEELLTDLYDVDHIVPRSITKDDSLDNKVLVKRVKNAEKTDRYPLPIGFTNQQAFWKLLKSKNLMSDKKYALLSRVKPLNEDDFREFVNRQLVITNQIAKAVAELLKRKFEGEKTKVVYSKASNVDSFKQKFDIVKCRETNDLHHARDAYLNVVVGNIYDTKFTSAYDYFYRKEDDFWREYNLKHLYDFPIKGAWAGKEDIARIKKIVAKTSMQVTRYAFVNSGSFYNETVYSKEDGAISAPRKMSEPYNKTEKYGGYKSLSTAYFAIVESKDKKGNSIKTIEAIPVIVDYKARGDNYAIIDYLIKCGLKEPKLLVAKLKIKTLVSVNGYKVWIAGVTGNQILIHNAQQWFTNEKIDAYVKQFAKLVEKDKIGFLSENEKQQELIPLISNKNSITFYATREENCKILQEIIKTLNKDLYQGLSSVRSFAQKIEEKQAQFKELSTFEQIKVLLQVIRFMKCNAECADLTLLKDGATCGKMLVGKNITDVDFAIIHQSPCGLNERIQKV